MAGDTGQRLDRIRRIQTGAESVGNQAGQTISHGRTAATGLAEADEDLEGASVTGGDGDEQFAAVGVPLNGVPGAAIGRGDFGLMACLLACFCANLPLLVVGVRYRLVTRASFRRLIRAAGSSSICLMTEDSFSHPVMEVSRMPIPYTSMPQELSRVTAFCVASTASG